MFKPKTIMFVIAIAFGLSLSSTASADMLPHETNVAPAKDELDAVKSWLASPVFIVSRSELRRIDSDPVPELIEVATNRRARPEMRKRAVMSLSLYRDARVKKALSGMLAKRPNRLFTTLVMAHLEAFGEDGVDDVARFLDHRDAKVRTVVVKGLGMFGGQKGYDLLVQASQDEEHPTVRALLDRYVG